MRIQQAFVGVKNFEKDFLKKWDLSLYHDIKAPAVFFGIYKNHYNVLLRHRGPAILIWAGSDIINVNQGLINELRRRDFHHVAISNFIAKDLSQLNIPFREIPITPIDYRIFTPEPLGDCIYMYIPETKTESSVFYGAEYLTAIQEAFPENKILVSNFHKHSRLEIREIYKQCFIAVRPTPHDGLSNTVVEMGMMGRRCIFNGNTPNAIHFLSEKDMIQKILTEKNRIGKSFPEVAKQTKEYVDIGTNWLELPTKRRSKPIAQPVKVVHDIPSVSVIINTMNEDPDILTQAIKSYLNQKDVKMQLIISSIQGDVSEGIAKDFGLTFSASPIPGIYEQLNYSLQFITGDWFAYASGNDIAMPTKMIDEVKCCLKHKKLVCYSDFLIVDENLYPKKKRLFHQYDIKKHLKGNFVNDCAIMHRSILDRLKPFDLRWGNHSYWDLWLRAYERFGNVFCYNPVIEWLYRQQPTSSHIVREGDGEKKDRNTLLMNQMLLFHEKRIR